MPQCAGILRYTFRLPSSQYSIFWSMHVIWRHVPKSCVFPTSLRFRPTLPESGGLEGSMLSRQTKLAQAGLSLPSVRPNGELQHARPSYLPTTTYSLQSNRTNKRFADNQLPRSWFRLTGMFVNHYRCISQFSENLLKVVRRLTYAGWFFYQ